MKICYDHRQKARNGRLRDFASKMSPFLNRFLADVRLTHFHRSGTWLAPTDISQTFLLFSVSRNKYLFRFEEKGVFFCEGIRIFRERKQQNSPLWAGSSLAGGGSAESRPANDDTLLKKRGSIFSYYFTIKRIKSHSTRRA